MKTKYFTAFLLIYTAVCTAYAVCAQASPYVYYEKVAEEELVRGVYYASYRQVTNQGLRDVYVLKVPIRDPYIKLRPADSALEYGFKQPTRDMLADSDAIAGINGDMFGIAGAYSNPFGLVVRDGVLRSLNTFSNFDSNTYASFFIEEGGNPFILYLKSEIVFLNNGQQNIEIAAKNKITDLNFPVYYDRVAMTDTSGLDLSFPDLYKIVVDNGVIVHVSGCGETVTIPENGYIIAMNDKVAAQCLYQYAVGQSAEIIFRGGVDYDKIESAIGGAGRILLDGEPVNDTGHVAPRMQPRTAIGITEDKSYAILMVVDGRTHSIGASQEDMCNLMKRFGAYNAMHLDGGGSSTMVVRNAQTKELDVVNTLSDGGERKVINALGVYDYAPIGQAADFGLSASHERVFKGTPVEITAYAIDEYLHKTPIPHDEVVITATDPGGYWSGGYFYPSITGEIFFHASYNGMISVISVASVDIGALYPSQSHIKVGAGGRVELGFSGISNNGYPAYIYNSGVEVRVYPPSLGRMENGVFVAEANGAGFLECRVGGVTAYVDVTVGIFSAPITSFEELPRLSFTSKPETVYGNVALSGDHPVEGIAEARLTYYFGLNDEGTQAAYMVFDEPVTFISNLVGLRMNVYGDNSGHWLRAMLSDANGETVYVDLAKSIDWEGYAEVEGVIPPDVEYPLTLDRIYVVSLANNEEDIHSIYLDNIYGIFEQEYDKLPHADSTPYADIMAADLSAPPAWDSFDLVIAGNLAAGDAEPDGYGEALGAVLERMSENARLAVFAGETDENPEIWVDYLQWNRNYYVHNYDSVSVVQMSSERGGILSTDPSQWLDFYNDAAEYCRKNIIIVMERSPLRFTRTKEYEIFHEMLKDIRDSGKNIIVVSTAGAGAFDVVEGIRYISLEGLIKDGSVNRDFKLLRLRVSPTDITYELQ